MLIIKYHKSSILILVILLMQMKRSHNASNTWCPLHYMNRFTNDPVRQKQAMVFCCCPSKPTILQIYGSIMCFCEIIAEVCSCSCQFDPRLGMPATTTMESVTEETHKQLAHCPSRRLLLSKWAGLGGPDARFSLVQVRIKEIHVKHGLNNHQKGSKRPSFGVSWRRNWFQMANGSWKRKIYLNLASNDRWECGVDDDDGRPLSETREWKIPEIRRAAILCRWISNA